jgi:capsular polysaccharide biosynthesis protein
MSFLEQIVAFQNATQIMGEYGSGLHNSVFAPGGAIVGALSVMSDVPITGFVQSGLTEAMCQEVGYLFGGTYEQEGTYTFTISREMFYEGLESMNQHSVDFRST